MWTASHPRYQKLWMMMTTLRNESIDSVEMKLVIWLLSLPVLALAYVEQYKGFDACGVDGWSCNYVKGKYNEIIYECSDHDPNARIWVWTARLPTGASILTVRNCKHLEVHVDCTKGLRSTILRQFNVFNVKHLEILPPILPEIFLHDNDEIPQMPSIVHLENVETTKFYPGLFDKAGGSCKYKYVELSSLYLINVHLDRLMKGLFHNQMLDKIVMKNVVIDAVDGNAVNLRSDAWITGTTFPYLPTNSILIKGETISFFNNTFKKISGLTVRSKEFTFSNNYVEEIGSQGLDVLGTKIKITKNVFNHLDGGAFERIAAGYSPVSYERASKFVYNFSENTIRNINPGSLHLDWELYKEICANIIFRNNKFDCSCINLGWISVSNGLGPKISKVKEFYDIYLNNGENTCNHYHHCSLNSVISQIQDVCNNKTNVQTICASSDNSTTSDTSTLPQDTTTILSFSRQGEIDDEVTLIDPYEVTEKIIPVLSYTENQTSHKENRSDLVWLIVLPIIVVLAAISLGIFMWWYKKKKQRQIVTTLYKNERYNDADNLIVINEHHNELFDKQ